MVFRAFPSAVIAALFLSLGAGNSVAEQYLSRDAKALDPGRVVARVDGWWGASHGAFDSDRGEAGLSGTPGTAYVRGAGLEFRLGMPGELELFAAGGYAVQEVKIDLVDSVSGWQGSRVQRGEGATDPGIGLKWSPLHSPRYALGFEAGVRVPAAAGPDRADKFYARTGSGSWGFPLGVRVTQYAGAITAHAAAFWEPSLFRRVKKWDGVPFSGAHGFLPGDASAVTAGAEVAAGPVTWGLEMSWEAAGRDHGAAVDVLRNSGRRYEVFPETESVFAVPSIRVPAGRAGELLVAAFIPLNGRDVYAEFSLGVAWRRVF
jgi:hypothetical protein